MEKKHEATHPQSIQEPLVHHFEEKDMEPFFTRKLLSILVVVAILGAGTGYLMAFKKASGPLTIGKMSSSSVSKGTTVGIDDAKTFKDTAEGKLEVGGVEGEGSFHLVRPGGDSQNVYLVSSAVDLSQFTGKKIKVWGQTQKAKTAGWLMDVGRIEVLE